MWILARRQLELPGLGLIHGAFLVIERLGLGSYLTKLPVIVRFIYVMLVVQVGWVFFRAETLPDALGFLSAMFGLNSVSERRDCPTTWIWC